MSCDEFVKLAVVATDSLLNLPIKFDDVKLVERCAIHGIIMIKKIKFLKVKHFDKRICLPFLKKKLNFVFPLSFYNFLIIFFFAGIISGTVCTNHLHIV